MPRKGSQKRYIPEQSMRISQSAKGEFASSIPFIDIVVYPYLYHTPVGVA
jgi:hypothetical protein